MNKAEPQEKSRTRPAPRARGREPGYSREVLARAAIAIADEAGIDAVSMRRVATAVGAQATSLYRYVNSKLDLLDLMTDAVMGEVPLPARLSSWREDLGAIAQHVRSLIKRHPWMISTSALRQAQGPNGLALLESTLQALDGHGLDADQILVLASTVSNFARGYAAAEVAQQQSKALIGQTHDEWMQSQLRYFENIRTSGAFPMFVKIVDEARAPHDDALKEQAFEQGLACVLDGIALRLEKSKPPA